MEPPFDAPDVSNISVPELIERVKAVARKCGKGTPRALFEVLTDYGFTPSSDYTSRGMQAWFESHTAAELVGMIAARDDYAQRATSAAWGDE